VPLEDADLETEILDPQIMRARARVGSVLHSKWRLDVLLGVGGMAAVYAATHRNGSRAAIKLLHPELSINHQARTRFQREGYVANAVGHEGVVRVTDDDIAEDGSAFLVMELLDGETLENRRIRCCGQLEEDEVLWLADQLLDVLVAAHAKGVIHRDLKPDNVFVTRAGQVKLLDYGIARLREVTSKSTATLSGATMGTPAFMPPEQARGLWDEVDGRSDLWALGATMFNLLTGRVVHEGRSANEQLFFAMTKEPPPLESVLPSATPAVCHLVNRALAFEKDRRWRDAGRMQEALRSAYNDRFGKPVTTSPHLVVPPSVPNRTLADSTVTAVGPRLPTTGEAVEAPHIATTASGGRPRNLSTAVLLGVATALVLTVTAVSIVSAVHRAPRAAVSVSLPSEVPVIAEAVSPPTAGNAAPTGPAHVPLSTGTATTSPVISVTDLPPAATQAPPAPVATSAARPRAASAAVSQVAMPTARATSAAAVPATATPSCNPPYTIDRATGKTHFRAECL
jgi:serine/threonine protein kinase